MRNPHGFVFLGINPQTHFLCSCFLAKCLRCVSVLDMRPPALMSVFLNLCSWAVEQMHEWEGVLGSEVTILFSDLECVTGHNCTSVPARVATCVSRLCHTNMLMCVVLFTDYVIKGWGRALVEKIQNPPKIYQKCIPLEIWSDSFSVFPRMFPSGHCITIQWLQTQNY